VYRSRVREDQARHTRRAIVDAAARLFVAHGYAGTTVDAVAEEAGVSRKTVFQSVGGKAQLLKLAADWTLVGDDEPVPMGQRPAVRRILSEADPQSAIRMWARLTTRSAARAAGIARVLDAAADVDPEAAALVEARERESRHGAALFVDHLASMGALRRGMSRADATDICWVFMDFAPYRRLVTGQRWSLGRYERWLARNLGDNLCGDATSR
jgi:AcrR family transcriptional regulator